MALLSQARALIWLLITHFRRASLRPKNDTAARKGSTVIFRILILLIFANVGRNAGIGCLNARDRATSTAWLLIALIGFGIGGGLRTSAPEVRGMRPPLSAAILEALPISEWVRIPLGLGQCENVFAASLGVVYGAAPELVATPAGLVGAAGFAIVTAIVGILGGVALGRILRITVDPLRLARFGLAMAFAEFAFFFPLLGAPVLAEIEWLTPLIAPVRDVSDALLGSVPFGIAALRLLPLGALAAVVIGVVERIGYDKGDVLPTTLLRKVASTDLTLDRVELVLSKREGGRWVVWIGIIYSSLVTGGAITGLLMFGPQLAQHPGALESMARFVAVLVALVASSGAFGRATRVAARDALARPMLAPLPIAPADLLAGKARAMRTPVLLAGATTFALVFAPLPLAIRVEVVLRGVALLVALVLHVEASVAVAFLTQGLGATRKTTGIRLESFLLALPLLAVASSPSPFQVVVSLASLALVGLAAKRAAAATVRFIDDADDDVDRETSTWRALLTFAVFQATQAIAARALASTTNLSETATAALGYAISAGALALLTVRARPAGLALLPAKFRWLGIGALLGGASGALAIGYVQALSLLDIHGDPDLLSRASGIGRAALVFSVVALAPPLEEVFFRGWLQPSIADDLGPRRAWLAPLVGAFAFAAVHPPISFLPVLVLGIVTGLLYRQTRSIGPGIFAHLVHNALVVALLAGA